MEDAKAEGQGDAESVVGDAVSVMAVEVVECYGDDREGDHRLDDSG